VEQIVELLDQPLSVYPWTTLPRVCSSHAGSKQRSVPESTLLYGGAHLAPPIVFAR